MQNMHIIHDILGYLIYKVLNLNINDRQGKEISNIYLSRVVNHIQSLNDNRYKHLLNLLFQLIQKNENKKNSYFKYLCDFVNHSKHCFIVEQKTNIQICPTIEKNYLFEKFSHKEISHEEMDAIFFINTEYNREAKLIIQIENELINILESKPKDTENEITK